MRVAIWAQAAYRQQTRNLGFVAESERAGVVAGWWQGGLLGGIDHMPGAWITKDQGGL